MMTINRFALMPVSGQKSFYNKAVVTVTDSGVFLRSYDTVVAAFIVNFGVPRLVRADYGRGLFVYMGDSDNSIHFAYDINYLNGWLYGAVQAVNRTKEFVMRGDKNELC